LTMKEELMTMTSGQANTDSDRVLKYQVSS
jgi:hypothetical protein